MRQRSFDLTVRKFERLEVVVNGSTETDDGDATVMITGTAQEDSVLTANFGNNDHDGPVRLT